MLNLPDTHGEKKLQDAVGDAEELHALVHLTIYKDEIPTDSIMNIFENKLLIPRRESVPR